MTQAPGRKPWGHTNMWLAFIFFCGALAGWAAVQGFTHG